MSGAYVIIGGTSGLGLSATRKVLAEGGSVVAVGRDEPSVATACDAVADGGDDRFHGFAADAVDPGTADRAVADCVTRFGRFDGLYHVAGGSGRRHGDGPVHEVTDAGVEYTLSLNLASVIYSNRAAVRCLLERGVGGSVVNMGSVLGSSPSWRHFSTAVYAAAKAGIEGLTRANAARYAADDIRFNVVAPALVDTPMAKRAVGDDAIRAFAGTKQPLEGGRVGLPGDLDGVVWLLLSEAGRYITGQTIKVDGGWSVSEGQFS
ncbi:MAG: SDR family oxidoreductase [Planctomycetota bacterium]